MPLPTVAGSQVKGMATTALVVGFAEHHDCNNNGKSDSWLMSRSLFIKRMAINNIPTMKICWVVFFHPGWGRLKREHAMICLAHGAKINSYCSDKNNKGICCIFGLPSSAVSVELSKQGACWARRETWGRKHGSVRCQPSRACTRHFILGLFFFFFISRGGLQWGSLTKALAWIFFTLPRFSCLKAKSFLEAFCLRLKYLRIKHIDLEIQDLFFFFFPFTNLPDCHY